MKTLAPALLLCWLSALPAHGQSQRGVTTDLDGAGRQGEMARLAQRQSDQRFEAADEDKNGVLSRAEVANHLPFFEQNFERYDKNKDGVLSWEEFVGHGRWKRQLQQQ